MANRSPRRSRPILILPPARADRIASRPIVYACFSRFGHHRAPEAANLALTLRLLLRHGADPDTPLASEHGPLSCLYAACGLNGNVEMTRLLLEAGARSQ